MAWCRAGGLGGPAILPLSIAKMSQLTQAFPDEASRASAASSSFAQALNYFLLGCGTVQVCTAAMLDHAIGPNVIKRLLAGMQSTMERHGWASLEDFRGIRRDRVVQHSKIRRPDGGPITAATTPRATPPRSWPRDRSTAPHGARRGRHGGRRAQGGPVAQPAVESGSRADAARAPHVVYLSHRRALDRHERGHHHLHARLGSDATGHDVVAGDDDDPAGQRHRPAADDPECARRHEVRRLVPGVLPRQLRGSRGQRPGDPARARRVRLVRHSNVDRRASVAHPDRCRLAGVDNDARRRVDLVRDLLARSGRDHHPRG